LIFPSNGVPGSDIRLVWSGAAMLPRRTHTVLWKAKHRQQLGYYATIWHTSNDGTWHASWFEYGTHAYPTTGTIDSTGQSTGGTGSSGAVHFFEIAGLGASDFIASAGSSATYPLVADVWLTQARTAAIVSANGKTVVRHRFWPDVTKPTAFIEQDALEAAVDQAAAAAVAPAFIIGCSPWTATGSTNSETPSATLRGFALFSAALSIADIATESASESNTPVTAAGKTSVWYENKNPTPSDVSDKSGAGHSPTWANANRPTLYVQ
jgi:hypothetical protein